MVHLLSLSLASYALSCVIKCNQRLEAVFYTTSDQRQRDWGERGIWDHVVDCCVLCSDRVIHSVPYTTTGHLCLYLSDRRIHDFSEKVFALSRRPRTLVPSADWLAAPTVIELIKTKSREICNVWKQRKEHWLGSIHFGQNLNFVIKFCEIFTWQFIVWRIYIIIKPHFVK